MEHDVEVGSMRFALLVFFHRRFLHSSEAIVHPLLSQSKPMVFSLSFSCETTFILQLNYSRSPSQRNTNVRSPRFSIISCCGFNGIAAMYDSLHREEWESL